MKHFVEATKNALRLTGRKVIESAPLSPDTKVQLKFLAFAMFGPILGIRRSSTQRAAERLRGVGERYRTLAGVASGRATVIPDRSVSIVIPVYNQLAYTLRCLEAIRENTHEIDYEIVVVDDCSTDGTQSALSAREDINYLRNERNLGFVGSCNAGSKRANRTYLCFLNNDTAVQPYWLSALVNTFELHHSVGLAGSKLIFPDGRLQEAGGLVWEDGSAWNWGRFQNPDSPRYSYARYTDYCSGASIVVPRALFDAVGGFDRHYAPAYAEDTDLAFKVRALGLATVYQPLSQVVHFEGVTSGTDTSHGVKSCQIENLKKLAKRWAPVLSHQGPTENAALACDRGIVGRVLILDQITPEPDRDAGSVAQLEIIQAFRALGYKVTFVPCSNLSDMPPYTDLLSSLGVESILLPWASSLGRHLKTFGPHYDAVMIFRPATWEAYIGKVRKYAPQAKIIFHACDLHFLRHQREAEIMGNGEETRTALEEVKTKELDIISGADLCTLHSPVEKQLVEAERPGTRVVIIPIIFQPQGPGKPMQERSGIVFLGGYRHPPNIDAVEYYLSEIHPLVRSRLSEPVRFTAAGDAPPPSLKSCEGNDVLVSGFIEDIGPLLHEARVMVAPLRYGAGVKGKILTALAHGLPVVTTSIGAEGIGDGSAMRVADTAEAFSREVCRLYTDEGSWRALHDAGFQYLRENTSRAVAIRSVAEALNQLDLPYLSDRVPALGASTSFPEFGSPRAVRDLTALVGAGQRALPSSATLDLVILPDGAHGAQTSFRGAASITHLCGATSHLADARTVVAVLDPTDSASATTLGAALKSHLRFDATCAIVVAPHRLVASAEGYAVRQPCCDTPADRITLPYHDALGFAFSGIEHSSSWHFDTSLTGFPAVSILVLSGSDKVKD